MVIRSLYKKIDFSTNPKVNPDDERQSIVKTERKHELILFNDEVNTFDYVTKTLMAVCDHTFIQAQFDREVGGVPVYQWVTDMLDGSADWQSVSD